MSAMATSLAALESAERARAAEEVRSFVVRFTDAHAQQHFGCIMFRRLLSSAALHARLTILGYCTVKVSCR